MADSVPSATLISEDAVEEAGAPWETDAGPGRRADGCTAPGAAAGALVLAPLLALSIGLLLAMVGYALASVAMLAGAVAITVRLHRKRPEHEAAGRGPGAWPLVAGALYLLSVPYLIFFIWFLFLSSPS